MAEGAKIDLKIFKRLLVFVKGYKKMLYITLLCTIALALISPFRPKLIGDMVNEYVVRTQNADALLKWTLIVFGLLVLESLLQFLNTFFSNLLAQSIIRDMRKKLFTKFLGFRMRYFDKTPNGNLVTRLVSDIEAISDIFSSGLVDIMGDLLILLLVLTNMFLLNWQLTLMVLIPIPILILATRIFARAMKKSFQAERLQVTRLNTFVQEHLSGMFIVQLFNREKHEYELFEGINKDHKRAHVKAVWAYSIFFPVVELLSALSIAFLLVWGGLQLLNEKPDNTEIVGLFITFSMYVNMIFRPIRQLADKFNILQRGIVRAERVFEVLDMDQDTQISGYLKDVDFDKDIVFRNVNFAYQDEKWVLKDIDLTIEKGKMVAFVGATGAGKSSIVNLLGRFYEYQKGEIRIGETDIQDIELSYLRRNIAIVLQDVFLFSDSILNNITFGDSSISREQVIQAAKEVGAHDFIMQLPGNYDYQVGERGGVLSVGQRQLLAFIRAYIFNPHILILDEATSSVDNESETLIQQATEKLTKGRTSIVIAHRLSTIQNADKIVVLDHGEIKEIGNHNELLTIEEGYYRKLYDIQFAE